MIHEDSQVGDPIMRNVDPDYNIAFLKRMKNASQSAMFYEIKHMMRPKRRSSLLSGTSKSS
jgi:hypothetical protein